MTVAVGQAAFGIGDVDTNLRTVDGLVRDAAIAGADLIVLPELVNTHYHYEVMLKLADGEEEEFLAPIRAAAVRKAANNNCRRASSASSTNMTRSTVTSK